jgi:uncharacterized YkwD family protein
MGLLLTAVLTMGLAACNNNDKNDINDQATNRVGMNNTNNRNNTPYMDVRNGRDNGIDHNGPLTEDYTNKNNSQSDLDANLYNNNRKNKKNNTNDDMISSYQTSLNSNQYPHTRAVLIRDAKYQYITMDPRSWAIQQIQPYIMQQSPTGQAPAQQEAPRQTTQAPRQSIQAPRQTTQTPRQSIQAPRQTTQTPRQTTQAPKQTAQAPKQPAQTQNAPATGTVSQYVQQVIDLTNAQRSKNGLPALKADTQLNGVAQKKSLDMQQKNYFSHTSPTYGSPFDMMRDFGVTYKSAGENIAQGQRTPQEVVTAWMNSEGHRKNILSSNFTHIGVGYEGTGKHWTQMFIGK